MRLPLILEKHLVVLEYFPTSLKIKQLNFTQQLE